MIFTQRGFLKKGFLDAVGNMPDYWVRLNANGWCDKGVLTLDDLAEINAKIEAQHPVEVPEELPEE